MKIVRYGFIFFCLFPWLSFNIIPTETQPWVIFFALLILISNFKSINIYDVFIIFIPFLVLLFGIMCGDDLSLILRSFFSYLIFSLVFLCFKNIILNEEIDVRFFKICNLVWVSIALVQLFFGNSIVDPFLVTRTSDDRGFTSVAPEPTFFAIFLFFMNWFYLILNNYKLNKRNFFFIFINSISIFLLAKSSLGMFLLVFGFVFLFFLNDGNFAKKILFLVLILILCVIFFVCIDLFLKESRIFHILNSFMDNPFDLFYQDASANERLKNIVYPFLGLIENNGAVGGFSSFQGIHDKLKNSGPDFFWYGDGDNKILSLIGSVVYELGFFGCLILLIILFKSISKSRKSFFEIIALFFVCLNAISIAFPMVAIIMSLILYRREKPYV